MLRKNRKATTHVLATQIFISYSRMDKVFTNMLVGELKKKDFKIWQDVQDIPPTAEWWQVITEAIDHSGVFLSIVSQHSMTSATCNRELNYALTNGKKIIPLLVDTTHPASITPALEKLNWVTWDNSKALTENLEALVFAIHIDLGWHNQRTSILSQTTFWINNSETKDVLLKGNMLLDAERWLDDSYRDKNKLITEDQRRFILQSRKAVARANILPVINGFILAAIFSQMIKNAGLSLVTQGTPYGILHLELARSQAQVHHILQTWSSISHGIDAARSSIFLDFAFIYAYTLLFYFSLKYFILYFHRRRKIISQIGILLLTLSVCCATLDIAENILLLKTLD